MDRAAIAAEMQVFQGNLFGTNVVLVDINSKLI